MYGRSKDGNSLGMLVRGCFLSLLMLMTMPMRAQGVPSTVTVAWWNVENLFDLRDDPHTNDDEFTPQGDRHWTRSKLNAKLNGIYKTLSLMDLPDLVGLAEVENKYVLRELTGGTPLAQAHYRYVHYDSPDRRGIDVALLYRQDRFKVTSSRAVSVSDSTQGFFTRDILVVEGVTAAGDSLCLLLNHWPSKRGGEEAEEHRLRIADTLRRLMVELQEVHPDAAVVAMGDMNATSDEPPVSEGMGFHGDSVSRDGIRLLTLRLPKGWGSHKYQGMWSYIDQVFFLAGSEWAIIDLKLMSFHHLLTPEKGRPGYRPRRSYQGPRYEGGLSDHLPLLLRLKKRQR